jgi:ABC-type Fe3+ transport system substrate-binding protein
VKKERIARVGGIANGVILLGLLAVPLLLHPSRGAEQSFEGGGQKLIVLSAHWEGARHEFERGFVRWMADTFQQRVDIEWLDVGGTTDMVKFIGSEFSSKQDGIGVDVVFGGGVEAHMHLAQKGLLQAVNLKKRVLQPIPETLFGMRIRDAQNRWFGAALSGFGIVYNRPVLKRLGLAEPRTWEDLAHPDMLTWVGSGDPRSSGSTHMVYEIILQAYGWQKGFSVLVRMGANVRAFTRSAADVPRDTALGEVACGMALDSYAWNTMQEVGGNRLGFALPPRLTVINPDSVAVLRGAPHPKLAARFVQYVLSRSGQALWMLPPSAKVSLNPSKKTKAKTLYGPKRFALTRMTVRPDLYPVLEKHSPVTINPFSWKGAFHYDGPKAAKRWEVINTLLGAALIDNHHVLQRAWKALIKAGRPPDLLARLTRAPLSETQLLELAAGWKNDPALRSRWRVRWVKRFRQRYERIVDRLQRHSVGGCNCRGVGRGKHLRR